MLLKLFESIIRLFFKKTLPALLVLVKNSNWVSRLFYFGDAAGSIEKCGANFFKEVKAAAFQLRYLPAVGAKGNGLKSCFKKT